jgi:hypothetical protein
MELLYGQKLCSFLLDTLTSLDSNGVLLGYCHFEFKGAIILLILYIGGSLCGFDAIPCMMIREDP